MIATTPVRGQRLETACQGKVREGAFPVTSEEISAVGRLADELFVLEMLIDMMILDASSADDLLKKCAVSAGNCRDLVTKLHWPTIADQTPIQLQ